jgi:hypothetical protein
VIYFGALYQYTSLINQLTVSSQLKHNENQSDANKGKARELLLTSPSRKTCTAAAHTDGQPPNYHCYDARLLESIRVQRTALYTGSGTVGYTSRYWGGVGGGGGATNGTLNLVETIYTQVCNCVHWECSVCVCVCVCVCV